MIHLSPFLVHEISLRPAGFFGNDILSVTRQVCHLLYFMVAHKHYCSSLHYGSIGMTAMEIFGKDIFLFSTWTILGTN